jgi:hypothetical protein
MPQIDDWQSQCQRQRRKCRWLWRTTVPGHPGCFNFTTPSNSTQDMENLIASHEGSRRFKWDQFAHQNRLVLETFHNRTDVQILDVYPMNILRRDAHPSANDCLHNCLPTDGIQDPLLLHLIRLWNDDEPTIDSENNGSHVIHTVGATSSPLIDAFD